MNVHYGLGDLPVFRHAVLTIGTFDGVHTGHRAILKRVKEKARAIGGESVVITFEPHPRFVIPSAGQPISLLNTLSEKIELFGPLGIDHLVVVDFTLDFANREAKEYIADFLVAKFHPHTLIIGFDHLFGKGRKGDFHLLESLQSSFGYELEEIPVQLIEQNKISSTQIRHALRNGDVQRASVLLGTVYGLSGTVVEGRQQGRVFGFPTANIVPCDPHKLIPAQGVYVVKVAVDGEDFGGMMNIGTNPTVSDGAQRHLEVHLFQFNRDIYGQRITVYFIERIRDELKFAGVDALIQAMENDRQKAMHILAQSA